MKKICLLVNSLQVGGAERVASHLANAWAKQGYSVTLLVTDSKKGTPAYPLTNAVNIVYLVDIGQAHRNGLWGYGRKFRALRSTFSKNAFDFVVSFTTHVNIATLIATYGLPARVFVAERSYPPLAPMGPIWDWLRRVLYPKARRVVMQTEDGNRWLTRNIPSSQGVVIPNPVQLPLTGIGNSISPSRIVESRFKVLLAVGRLDQGKQFDHLIRSFAAISDTNVAWRLVILGDGPERLRLAALVNAFALDSKVLLPGRAENMAQWYQRASLFVMTSRFEGFPNALLEALAHGCPAVAYDCDTGPRDIIRDGIDGLLVKPVGNISGLSGALQMLMQDEALRTRMATNAPEVRDRFSMESVLHQWQQLFEEH